jgi:hypothetical protein
MKKVVVKTNVSILLRLPICLGTSSNITKSFESHMGRESALANTVQVSPETTNATSSSTEGSNNTYCTTTPGVDAAQSSPAAASLPFSHHRFPPEAG